MFEIMSNQNIRINAGDTASFEVELTDGSCEQNIRKFIGVSVEVKEKSPSVKTLEVDKGSWYTSNRAPGEYKFIFNGRTWTLDSEKVNLLSYGIYIPSMAGIESGDYFVLTYTKGDASTRLPYGSYITLYVLYQNPNPEAFPLFTKQFFTTGRVVKTMFKAGNCCPDSKITTNLNNVSENGNFRITLDYDDTADLLDKTYMYLLKVNYMEGTQEKQVQVGNKHFFYVINDNYDGRIWNCCTDKINGCIGHAGIVGMTASDIDAVSYAERQILNEEQQALARKNIDAISDNDVDAMLDDLAIDELDQTPGISLIFNGNA